MKNDSTSNDSIITVMFHTETTIDLSEIEHLKSKLYHLPHIHSHYKLALRHSFYLNDLFHSIACSTGL